MKYTDSLYSEKLYNIKGVIALQDVFFTATKKALSNITSTYDTVWPTAVGLWNLRCMVNGVKKEFPAVSESELAAKFSLGSGIHGVNYKRAFLENSWEMQQAKFAWILLNSTIPIFEGWLEELKQTIFPDLKIKDMQFPGSVQVEVTRLKQNSSAMLINSFYQSYSHKRDRCYANIDALMKCYRVFKETRNCYMHNGSKADAKLINAYTDYIPVATKTDLCVSEVPEFIQPILGSDIQISLRGVVGFSYILIKIMVSLDSELLCTSDAEKEILARYKEKHTNKDNHFILRTLKPDLDGAHRQVKRYIQQCGFPVPQTADDLTDFLLKNRLVSR